MSEDEEPYMEKPVRSQTAANKAPPGGRKHSLPQQRDLNGLRQVGKICYWLIFDPTD